LIGSPKKKRSTSEVLGDFLLDRLMDEGMETDSLSIQKHLRDEDSAKDMLSRCSDADLIILAFPLYIDSLPWTATKALELIAEHRKENQPLKEQRFMGIVNSGFPEASQSDVAMEISKCFAKKTGFKWAGGLALGGGGAINGRPLDELGSSVRNVKKSLELCAKALANGRKIPSEAMDLMSKPMVPKRLYIMGGNMGWKIGKSISLSS